jgi:hypothetical protein
METAEIKKSEKVAIETTERTPKVIKQKYVLKLINKDNSYHPLPKKERKNEGKIGSQFLTYNGQVSRAIIRGLDTNQERYFASRLINKTPKDFGYDEAMTQYWADFTIFVDRELQLDASYTIEKVKLDGTEVEIKVPVNLEDYIKVMFAKQNSRVAFTELEKQNKDLYDFVLEDLSIAEKTKEENFKLKTRATSALADLFKSSSEQSCEKIDWLLEVLKEPNELFYSVKYIDKCIALTEKAEANPGAFLNALEDKNLENRALLYRLIQTGIVIKEGESYFFGDTLVGSTEKECIVFLSDPTKSMFVVKMKAQLKEITY